MNIYIKSILGALAFSFLFYSKSFGLNVVLISIIVTVFLTTIGRPYRFRWGYAIPYLFTAGMVFGEPSGFHLFVHLVALVVFIGKSVAHKSSIYISAFTGLMNIAVAALVNFVDNQRTPSAPKKAISPQGAQLPQGGNNSPYAALLLSLCSTAMPTRSLMD